MAKGEVKVEGFQSPEFLAPGWSISNTVSPSAAGLANEGYGDLSVEASPDVDDEFLIDRSATVTFSKDDPDPDTNDQVPFGTVEGWVSGYSTYGLVEDTNSPSTRGPASLTITPNLAVLNADRSAPAVVNVSLSEAFQTYVNLVTDTIPVNYTASSNPLVSFPGWTGNVWEYISNLAAIKGVELSYDGESIVVRDIQAEELEQEFFAEPSYRMEEGSTGQYVEVAYQDQQVITSIEENLTNYSENPKLGVNATNWVSDIGAGERTTTTPGGVVPWGDTTSFLSASQAAVLDPSRRFSRITHHVSIPSSLENTPVTAGIWCRATVTDNTIPITWVQVPVEASLELHWYNSSDVLIHQEWFTAPASFTVGFLVPSTVPPGAVRLEMILSGTYGPPPSGVSWDGRFYSSGAFLTQGTGVYYFDGDSPGASWTGTPENSTSTMPNPNNIPLYDAYLDNNRIMEVAVGAVESYVLESNVWATSLLQPIPSNLAPVGVGNYHIIDSQGVPCTGAFVGLGGEVTVSLNDLGQIVATLKGPQVEASINGGPYRVASSDGNTTRGEFRIAGTGIITHAKTLRVPTGADPSRFSEEVAYSITYPFINDISEAYTVGFATGAYAAAAYPVVQFSFRTDDMDQWDYAAGKWFEYNGSKFRIISATVSEGSASITAQQRTLYSDVDEVYNGLTFGQVESIWGNLRYRDTLIKPLKES